MWWKKYKNEIIDSGLYSRSGTEVGLSEGILKLTEKDGDYFIKKCKEKDIPEIAYKASSDKNINYPELNKNIFGRLPKNWLIGNYKKIYIGHILNKKTRRNAASGGIISGIQLYLLKNNIVDGVITVNMREDKPYLAEPIIATTEKEILNSAQSKYSITPTNSILSRLPGRYRSLSYTGLPEQVASIRKLQKYEHKSVENINYIVGMFCGHTISFNAIISFLRAHRVYDLSQIKKLEYRAGEWPGYLRVELKNGKVIAVRKFHANYLIPSHITDYSFYQVDYMSELSDISVGDAWAPTYEKRGEGWSVIVARTDKGIDLLNRMNKEGEIFLDEITEQELIKMHSHGLDFKKRGSFIRIERRKKKGKAVPDYGYRPVNISRNRKRFEIILGIIFNVFQNKITIYIMEKISPKILGWFFVQARNIWKKRTKSAKKNKIEETIFKVETIKS